MDTNDKTIPLVDRLKYAGYNWPFAGAVLDEGVAEMVLLREQRDALADALMALSHSKQDLCWCGLAIGDPHYREHSAACEKARAALQRLASMT